MADVEKNFSVFIKIDERMEKYVKSKKPCWKLYKVFCKSYNQILEKFNSEAN